MAADLSVMYMTGMPPKRRKITILVVSMPSSRCALGVGGKWPRRFAMNVISDASYKYARKEPPMQG